MADGSNPLREYKTVAMPQLLPAKRRRGRSAAEAVAEALSGVINAQAQRGWSYVGADTFRAMEKRGLFGGREEVVYTVLVFDREAGSGPVEPEMSDGGGESYDDVEERVRPAPRKERPPRRAPRRAEPAPEPAGRAGGGAFDTEVDRAGAALRERRLERARAARSRAAAPAPDDWDDGYHPAPERAPVHGRTPAASDDLGDWEDDVRAADGGWSTRGRR